MSFEERLKKLESISEEMRNDNISLEKSITSFENGIKLAEELEKELEGFEKRVEILITKGDENHLEEFK